MSSEPPYRPQRARLLTWLLVTMKEELAYVVMVVTLTYDDKE